MDFVTPIITPIVESLIVPVKRHLSFWFHSTKYVTDMHAKIRLLNNTAEDIKEKRVANEATTTVLPHHVPDWLSQVERINEEVNSILTDGNGCLNIKMRYKAGKRSSDVVNDIVRLIGEKTEIEKGWTNEQRALGLVVSSPMASTSKPAHDDDDDGTQNIFHSRKLIFDAALESLDPNNNNTQKIALCGMGGVGKTTMMEQLKEVVKKKNMFNWVITVVIGEKPDLNAIQQTVAEYEGEALSETSKYARAERLRERFLRMSENGTKKILVILDDVWEEFDLKDIGLVSPLHKGFKLLLISRKENVCSRMGVETNLIFKMFGLKEEEAKHLFWGIVGHSDEDGHGVDEFHKLGDGILKMCGGLPIAIKTIASTLNGAKKDAWELACSRLQRHHLKDLEGFYDVVHDIFEISYNNLKTKDDKAIFILSGLFLDDFDIPLEELMIYGWGLKFFEKAYSLTEARQQTSTSVDNLVRANLLTESHQIGCVKMHDLARAFVLSDISKFKQASIVNHANKSEWPREDVKDTCERFLLNCTGMSELPEDFNYLNLTLLKLMKNTVEPLKFPNDFYKRMGKLEAIAYENMQYPLLPISLQCSTSLRTLCLRSCLLPYDVSFLGDLSNLEVLSFANCGISKLPSTIGKLRKLKLLDLTRCVNLCVDDGVFSKLDTLEELYMKVSERKAIRFTDANCDEFHMLSKKLSGLEFEFFENKAQPKHVSFHKLKRFKISIGCPLEENANVYSYKNTLKLVTSRTELLGYKINLLFEHTEELHLSVKDMNHLEEISTHPYQQTFRILKVLHVFQCASLTHLFQVPVANGMKNLESLTVSSCPALVSLIHGENSEAGLIKFPNLKLLSLEGLPELVSLCDTAINKVELPQLMELRLDGLLNFTSIFSHNNIDISTTRTLLNKKVVTPNLEKLRIKRMEKLEEIWSYSNESEDNNNNNISKLREISMQGCDSVVNLFPRNPMRLLSHLEELRVVDCGSIEVLFNIDLGGKTEQLSSNSSLRRLGLWELKKLREVWSIKDSENNDSPFRGFQSIESIGVYNCEKFRNVLTPTKARFHMGALAFINILRCGQGNGRNNVELVEISQEQEIYNMISKEEKISKVAFPFYQVTHTFHQLRNVFLNDFKGAETVFEIETENINREYIGNNNSTIITLLPSLEYLDLKHMETMTHVWKCNWNEFFMKHQPLSLSSSFQNLTTIYLYDCKSIKYLFSPLMTKLLSNLKFIYIILCDGIEEVVSSRDDEDGDEKLNTTTLFSRLNYLLLYKLPSLKYIGDVVTKDRTNVICDHNKLSQVGIVSWSLCQYFEAIKIENCNALSSVIPCYAAGQMQKLQVLEIRDCGSLMEVFDSREISSSSTIVNQGSSSGTRDTTILIPRPKSITIHRLPNLKKLSVASCDQLDYTFIFPTIESLRQLEELDIRRCKAMKVIVMDENGEHTMTSSKVVEFPRLKSIVLDDLPNLAGFFLGINDLQCPLLDYVMISRCPQMSVFTSGDSTTPNLNYIHTWLGKHSFECGLNFHAKPETLHQNPSLSLYSSNSRAAISEGTLWSFQNLIEMKVTKNNILAEIIPPNDLLQLQNLEKIHVKSCGSVEEVFKVVLEVTNSGFNESITVVKFPKLREVKLKKLKSLKYIWKSNKQKILEFPSLTKLSIKRCNSLKHVLTCSMVGSLMQLQELHVSDCENIEVIVKEDEEEEECDAKVSQIKFPCLKALELEFLPNLKGFCLGKEDIVMPSLDTLQCNTCPAITIFTEGCFVVPELKEVETNLGLIYGGENINSFIITQKQEGINIWEPL